MNAQPGYYAILVKEFNDIIDWDNWYDRMHTNPDKKMGEVLLVGCTPSSGTLVVRVAQQKSDNEPEYIAQPIASGGGRKRGREDDTSPEGIIKALPALTREQDEQRSEMIQRLSEYYDMSAVLPRDQQGVLAVLYAITTLTRVRFHVGITSHPASGIYEVIVSKLGNFVEWIRWYETLRLRPDPEMANVRVCGMNPHTGTLHLKLARHGGAEPLSRSFAMKRGRTYE